MKPKLSLVKRREREMSQQLWDNNKCTSYHHNVYKHRRIDGHVSLCQRRSATVKAPSLLQTFSASFALGSALKEVCQRKVSGPYPSSLRFTAHSSISPKTSKRRFSSVRVQSDLSRPTYTIRLSSCSLRGKTDREEEIKGGVCCFFPPLLSLPS